ncbi:hypothetical protein ACVMB0_003501 [Bradyrhizobium sp. USDA 4451]
MAILCGIRAITDETPPARRTDFALGIDEARRFRRHAQIGHLDQHEGATDHPARRRRNDRLVELDAEARDRVPHIDGKVGDIGTDGEILLLRGSQHRDAIVAVPKP